MNYSYLREVTEQELADYLNDLFWAAFKKAPFEVLCALLRVSGIQDAEWDPLSESLEAFEDYNEILRDADEKKSPKKRWRIGLLMYCQAVEMTAPQEFLFNILRCLNGQQYHIKPFGSLGRSNRKKPFSWVPPSATVKYKEIKKLSDAVGQSKISGYIDQFFDDNVRNAFSHSDYVITTNHFRWTEGGPAQQISLEQLNHLILNCFRFFSILLGLYRKLLKDFAHLRKYHKWPNYEVLELLTNADGLHGFSVHFSNGSKATYSRTIKGVDCTNIIFQMDGSVNFNVGLIDELKKAWLVDGKPYDVAI